ncbi:hypothetical protein CUMW_274680 [Citrus unshiu]|uniref:Uncharacterized protein n=1 Tax=Citrus unshiu TaxID=55188 RepID=A0A2H5MYU8_CITUN|nr:hypothetical protein CUMW_274680 [Citrus unshiu]
MVGYLRSTPLDVRLASRCWKCGFFEIQTSEKTFGASVHNGKLAKVIGNKWDAYLDIVLMNETFLVRASTHKLDDVCNASDIWDDLEEFVLDNQNGSTSTDNGY